MAIPRGRTSAPPPTRRGFHCASDELGYCEDKVAHFLLVVGSRARARRYVERMRTLLRGQPSPGSIGSATARALVAEFDRDWARGAAWRREEASRVDRLRRSLRSRAHLADHAATWPWLGLDAVTRHFRMVLRTYEAEANPRQAARVRTAIESIRWVEL